MNELIRRKINELELLRLKRYVAEEREIINALRAGRSTDRFIDLCGMKERYLEALAVYGRFGLTPSELYKKWKIWLRCLGERIITVRVKTISMFLLRLQRHGLVRREREGRTFRYFITLNGIKRLNYYKNHREKC